MAGIDKKLTDLSEAASASEGAFLHIVEPLDISQSPQGSSFKIKRQNFFAELYANIETLFTTKLDSVQAGSGITVDDSDPLNPIVSLTSGTGDVVGPASSVNNRVAFFDGTTGKLLKDSGLTLSGTNTGDQDLSGLAPLNPRVQTVASSATVTPVSTNDIVTITAQAAGLTLANPTGTFAEGQALMIRIKDNGTARSITFGSNYRAIGITLPATTVISKTMYLGIIYNSTDGKWDVLGLNEQA